MLEATSAPTEFQRMPWEGILAPDWRRIRAIKLLAQPRNKTPDSPHGRYASRKLYDPLTIRYVEFLRKLLGYTTQRGVRLLALRHPDLLMANKVDQEPTLRTLEIKARALAGQSDRAIARAVALPAPTVAAYLGLFFDVRERLRARTWIRHIVIGLEPDQVPSVEMLALWHAWRRGPTVVEPWFDFLHHQGEHYDLRTEVGRQRAAIKLLVDVQQLPDTPETRRSLVKKMAYLSQNLPEIPKTVSLAGVIARKSTEILDRIAWKPPETEMLTPATERRGSSPKPNELEFTKYGKAG